jgi:hypothetical protein
MLGSDRAAQPGLTAICSGAVLNAFTARTAVENQLLISKPLTRIFIPPRLKISCPLIN